MKKINTNILVVGSGLSPTNHDAIGTIINKNVILINSLACFKHFLILNPFCRNKVR
jgi:hypothetical protein